MPIIPLLHDVWTEARALRGVLDRERAPVDLPPTPQRQCFFDRSTSQTAPKMKNSMHGMMAIVLNDCSAA